MDLFGQEEESRILELRKLLDEYNHMYYVQNRPVVSDFEFDRLMRELQDLEARHPELADPNSPTQHVGSDLEKGFRQAVHQYPMLSLDNTYSQEEVQDFFHRVEGLLNEPFEICCELKFDGLSISLVYHEGKLVQAVTRGDGVKGDVVTENVRTIASIPHTLKGGSGYLDDFEIRGEVLMPWASFDELNRQRELSEEPLFANPRNAASGTLKQQNPRIVAERKLDSYLYYLLGEDLPGNSHYENMQAAKSWGFQISEHMKVCRSLQEVMDYINYWDEERRNLPVATDGIVLKVNSIRQQKNLGYKAKSPRWAIAYKFQAEKALTKLESVSFQVGRTGAVTPVANLAPVQLSGTVVKRATLNNANFIESLDLHIGDMVSVEKGGEIIPKITAVDLDARKGAQNLQPVRFIDRCPECGTPLVRYEGEAAFYCPNSATCPPQIKGRIEHFISRKAMNIDGLGPETVDAFYQQGMINEITDLYSLSELEISSLDRMGTKSAQNILKSLDESRKVPFERVLFALGIRFVGETVAKILARAFKSLDALENATYDELIAVDEVGDKIARSILEYFQSPANRIILERVRQVGLQTRLSEVQMASLSDRLQGKSIVISGVFMHHSRDEYKSMIESNGGKNVGSISAKTSFILAGDNMGPSKKEKANKLGIPLVSEEEFLKMLEN
ncbi:MAG: NAD-dependent DNA ligase LigA [Bacteroidaceae bacterium]|nr:NAD-dependent DNA ligase LigA [Bacteroidaceae bacterium]